MHENVFIYLLILLALVPCIITIIFSKRTVKTPLIPFFLFFFFIGLCVFFFFHILCVCAVIYFDIGTFSLHFNMIPFFCVLILFFFILVASSFFFSIQTNEIFCVLFVLCFFSLCAISAADYMTLYVLLECITICVFILIKLSETHGRAADAAIKYLIVNLLSSSLFLLGICFLYIQWGTLNFAQLTLLHTYKNLLYANTSFNFEFIFDFLGGFLILIAFLIKLSLFPFHNWLLDAYQGFFGRALIIISCFTKPVLLVIFLNVFNNIVTINFYVYLYFIIFWYYFFIMGKLFNFI